MFPRTSSLFFQMVKYAPLKHSVANRPWLPATSPGQFVFDVRPRSPVRLATTRLGITVRGIRRVREVLIRTFGASRYEEMSTADVYVQWVKPMSFPSRCRLVELREVVPAEDVGQPMYFISHACG